LPNVTSLTLGRLNPDQVEMLVERVTDGRKLPPEVATASRPASWCCIL
jgi:hypothetical protein